VVFLLENNLTKFSQHSQISLANKNSRLVFSCSQQLHYFQSLSNTFLWICPLNLICFDILWIHGTRDILNTNQKYFLQIKFLIYHYAVMYFHTKSGTWTKLMVSCRGGGVCVCVCVCVCACVCVCVCDIRYRKFAWKLLHWVFYAPMLLCTFTSLCHQILMSEINAVLWVMTTGCKQTSKFQIVRIIILLLNILAFPSGYNSIYFLSSHL
jgi:hypothetical protein